MTGTGGGNIISPTRMTLSYPGGTLLNNYNFGALNAHSVQGKAYVEIDGNGVFDTREPGLAGVSFVLTGVNDWGQSMGAVTVSNGSGDFAFTGLRPGSYTLTEVQPAGYADGPDSVGNAGGSHVPGDTFTLQLGPSNAQPVASGYTFGELLVYGKPEMFNSDQGAQFTSEAFTEVLKTQSIASTNEAVKTADIAASRYCA